MPRAWATPETRCGCRVESSQERDSMDPDWRGRVYARPLEPIGFPKEPQRMDKKLQPFLSWISVLVWSDLSLLCPHIYSVPLCVGRIEIPGYTYI